MDRIYKVLCDLDFLTNISSILVSILVSSTSDTKYHVHKSILFEKLAVTALSLILITVFSEKSTMDFLDRRFIPKAAETQSVINDYLKGSTKNDKSLIVWTDAAEQKFEKCPEVTLNFINGQSIIGTVFNSRNGREFNAFQGIPYAEPPIGKLRLRNPVPVKPWTGELNATSKPNMCIQKNVFVNKQMDKILGSEDCLYLNVYTPTISNENNELMPVMVWIPGGGFTAWHGGMSMFGPQYLLDKDVIVVSINYRLGILGFISTEDEHLPGNFGMKDQVLALKWVRANIENFGGDPNKVTIFGGSAGGASVGLHLLSPMSKGLFHKAIMESGTSLCRWAVSPPGLAKQRAEVIATITACPEDSKGLAECLRDVPAEVLVKLQKNFYELLIFPKIVFPPVVENCENSNDSFLCKYPFDDFVQESKVPVLMGLNTGEGAVFAARLYDEDGIINAQLEKNFNYYVASILLYKYSPNISDVTTIGKKIFKRYFPDKELDDPFKMVQMIGHGYFIHGINDMAMKLSSKTHYYVYDHSNKFSFSSRFGAYPKKLGVCHCDELISLFFIRNVPMLKRKDLEVSKLMVNIWTQFATTDKLTTDGTTNETEWPIFTKEDMKYVLIQTNKRVISEKPYMDEYEFWNSLGV